MTFSPVKVGDEVSKESVEPIPLQDLLILGAEHVCCYGNQHLQGHMTHYSHTRTHTCTYVCKHRHMIQTHIRIGRHRYVNERYSTLSELI